MLVEPKSLKCLCLVFMQSRSKGELEGPEEWCNR